LPLTGEFPLELGQATAQAVDLVGHHGVYEAGCDIGQKVLKRRALQGRTRQAFVGVQTRRRHGRRRDIGLT